MSKYHVELDQAQQDSAKIKADSLKLSIEEYISRIVHNHLDALHSIECADFKQGYADYTVDINNL
jgi:hypothetical protein